MSSIQLARRPVGEDARARPGLRVVEGRRTLRSPAALVLAAVVVLVLAVLVPLVINTQMAETAYAMRDRQVELAELQAERTTLQSQLLRTSSGESLESKARAQGMVPAGNAGVVSLRAKTVRGGEPAR